MTRGVRTRRLQKLKRASRLATGAALTALLAACSHANTRTFLPAADGATRGSVTRPAAAYYLYVGELGPPIKPFKVYPIDGSKPVRQFHREFRVTTMAIDRWGDIYTADDNPSGGSIIAYSPGGEKQFLSFLSGGALALAFDRSGNLFEADNIVIREFAARSKKQLRIITHQTRSGDALAFDQRGNLYLARPRAVEVFAPGANKPFRSIRQEVHDAVRLAFDKSDALFVADCPACYSSSTGGARGSVVEYAPGSNTPLRIISEGIDAAVDLAFGSGGLLFVANAPFGRQGWVSVYPPGGAEPIRTVTTGILSPLALAVGPEGDLYVASDVYANHQTANITVYSPDGSRVLRTITSGIHLPAAIAIGKE